MAWNQDFGEGANPGSTYEQQSWRDSYNGGNAAGDWTGNHNARLESERDRFQGATWSGSSSQPSALELARSFVGSGQSGGTNGRGATGTGAGNAAVRQVAPRSGSLTFSGTGPGGAGAKVPWRTMSTPPDFVPPMDRLEHMLSPSKVAGRPLPFLGVPIELNPYVPPAQVIEDELGEGEFLSPGWFAQWAAVPGHISWNVERLKQSTGEAVGRSVDSAYKWQTTHGLNGPYDDLYDPTKYPPMAAW